MDTQTKPTSVSDEPACDNRVVVIGAGPAGLTAAYELIKSGVTPVVLEKGHMVGGLARTETYKGFYFDMGGHRFFTKSDAVQKFWREILADEFLRRPRQSRIFYKKKFFNYPLKPLNALMGLGLWESFLIIMSYVRWKLFPYKQENTFEEWVTNRFGRRLFLTFFKTYTEKVWGIPCSELRAEWAAQRIKNLSLKSALMSMFFKPKGTITTLIDQFDYPRLGPGMMWNAVKRQVEQRDGVVRLNTDVVRFRRNCSRIENVVVSCNGQEEVFEGSHFISSMPVTEFIKKLDPPAPPEVLQAAGALKYRDFLTVCLIVNKPHLFSDNWVYIHDPSVKVGRIQNYKNWSPDMVPDPAKSCLGLEYFCAEGDELWTMTDADLIELGRSEVDRIGLANRADIDDGCVIRVPKSYPVYDADYREYLATIRQFVDGLANFQTVGRNGLHRYNNQDHAMLTGMLAVRNLTLGEKNDLWSVNTDQEYHEEIRTETGIAPELAEAAIESALQYFGKIDRVAFGVAMGLTSGLVLFLITLILVLKGGDQVGPMLSLLNQFFPGYRVSLLGSVIGLAYGCLTGFVIGWSIALLRNVVVLLSMATRYRRAERRLLRELLDYL